MPVAAETAVSPSAVEQVPAPPAFATGAAQNRATLRAVPIKSLPRPSLLSASLQTLEGAGPRWAEPAAEIGIETVGDMLLHVPHGYRDRRNRKAIASLRKGEAATVMVEVQGRPKLRPTRNRRLKILEVLVADDSGSIKVVWFNQAWLADKLEPGTRLLLQGSVDRWGFKVATHELLDAPRSGKVPPGLHTTGLVPVHPATEGLRPDRLREWAWQVRGLERHAIEGLPGPVRARRRLAGAGESLLAAHFPAVDAEVQPARTRLAFEELFLYQAALASRRDRRRTVRPAPALDPPGELVARWLSSLPFEPTADQRQAFEEVDADLVAGQPMQRLLMGEVGSGKTVVALYAMLRALECGWQAAMMAPTETLAEQHFQTLERLLAAEGLPVALLTGATPAARRREMLGHLATGQLGLIVGTHSLIERSVEFARLAVAVVDEQHRFGVRQRAALDAKGPPGQALHVLHMTATPIPRTLSLTAYGDLDTTTLRELPAGRKPVKTWVAGEAKREGAYEFIRERLREGRQCYVVCPLVEESEKLQATAATEEAKRLAAGELAEFSVGVLHGQMRSADKAAAMAAFVEGATQVLVATSVIEVGIDVPNATVMLIESAERYGLSQLHQLRGRIGRGEHESHCILFSDVGGGPAHRRLKAIAAERDGFKLAEVDLALRGEGEILGTRQHGLPRFRVASLPEDTAALFAARQEVIDLVRRHGSLEAPELGPLMDAVRQRFGDEELDPIPA